MLNTSLLLSSHVHKPMLHCRYYLFHCSLPSSLCFIHATPLCTPQLYLSQCSVPPPFHSIEQDSLLFIWSKQLLYGALQSILLVTASCLCVYHYNNSHLHAIPHLVALSYHYIICYISKPLSSYQSADHSHLQPYISLLLEPLILSLLLRSLYLLILLSYTDDPSTIEASHLLLIISTTSVKRCLLLDLDLFLYIISYSHRRLFFLFSI